MSRNSNADFLITLLLDLLRQLVSCDDGISAVGTALGSNIINILLILGLAALVRPFTVHSDVLRRELPLMLLFSVVAGSVLYDGQLSRSDGIFLLFLAVLWLLFIVKLARQAERQGTDSLTCKFNNEQQP